MGVIFYRIIVFLFFEPEQLPQLGIAPVLPIEGSVELGTSCLTRLKGAYSEPRRRSQKFYILKTPQNGIFYGFLYP